MPGKTKQNKFKTFIAGGAFLFTLGFGWTIAEGQIDPREKAMNTKIMTSTLDQIKADASLYRYTRNQGARAFARNCVRCHGSEGRGGDGIPALNDDDWIWGGNFGEIYWTIQYGVRGENDLARQGSMIDFSASEIVNEEEATELAEFVLTMSDDPDFESPPGKKFTFLCSTCHGPYGGGYSGFGAPALNDEVWLYSGTVAGIRSQILAAKHGVMPSWEDRLPPEVVKSLAVYVHSLGGGE